MSKSLDKLKSRYYKFKDMPSVSALSLQGIKVTKDVEDFIEKHNLKIKAGSVYFPKDKKLRRLGASYMSSTGKKVKGVRGY